MTLKNLVGFSLSALVVVSVTLSGGIIAWQAGSTGEQALKSATQSRLTMARDLQKNAIEHYFAMIQSQIRSYAGNATTIAAMDGFAASYDYIDGSSLTAENQRRLQQFYQGEFDSQFQTINAGESADTNRLISSLSPRAQALQSAYIANNHFPLGQKSKLDSAATGTQYDAFHEHLHPGFRNYLDEFGFYDIFLVEPEQGTIVYSVFKELDFGTSLKSGPYANSGIASVFEQALAATEPGAVFLTDFSPYLPSYNNPAAFAATAIFNEGKKTGVLIFQIPIEPINALMSNHRNWEQAGLGQTGESYLVGRDLTMRSLSRQMAMHPEDFRQAQLARGLSAELVDSMLARHTSIGLLPVGSAATSALFSGEAGVTEVESYYGEAALTAYAPINIAGLDWGIVAQISEQEAVADATALRHTIMTFSSLTIVVMGVVAIVLGRFLACYMVAPMRKASQTAETIASGKLSGNAQFSQASNEIGQLSRALSTMSERLRTIVSQIHNGSRNLDASAREFAAQSDDLAMRTEEQAAAVRQTAVTLEQLSALANRNSASASAVTTQAGQMHQNARDSEQAMQSMITSIADIKNSSSKILDVVDVVEEIAFQTNLLALNASVEAARAGEHGRGFAVVATEVRNLALRSAAAVKQIDDLTKNSNKMVDQGADHAQHMSDILQEFKATAESVRQAVSEMGDASNEQAIVISELNDTIRSIEEMTQQNAASVQQSAVGSRRLEQLSSELQDNVSYFTV